MAKDDRLQLTDAKKHGRGRKILNSDIAMFHNLTGDSKGRFKGKFCPQLRNDTLFDCSRKDASYLPLSRNAHQVWEYSRKPEKFYSDIIQAFLKMMRVPEKKSDENYYRAFTPQWGYLHGVRTCLGDIFEQGCESSEPESNESNSFESKSESGSCPYHH